jgi:hypothetical protein
MSQQDLQLTMMDLATLRGIVDTACSRGAFRGEEMRVVGETYDKLNAFLNQAVSQAQEAQTKEKQND